MPNRVEEPQPDQQPPELESGAVEWLYDTLDETTPVGGRAGRRRFPWLAFVMLVLGVLVVGGMLWLLLGPSLQAPGSAEPEVTPTPTSTPQPRLTDRPTVTVSPTPVSLSLTAEPDIEASFEIGNRVVITGTGSRGLRLRAGAGQDFTTLEVFEDGDVFFVMPGSDEGEDYPIRSAEYVWWRLRSPEGLVGWTVEDFLLAAPLVDAEPTPTLTGAP